MKLGQKNQYHGVESDLIVLEILIEVCRRTRKAKSSFREAGKYQTNSFLAQTR